MWKMYALYLLRSSARVHRDGVDELRRNTADRGPQWDVCRGVDVGTVLELAVAGDVMAGKGGSLVQGHGSGLDTWYDTEVEG